MTSFILTDNPQVTRVLADICTRFRDAAIKLTAKKHALKKKKSQMTLEDFNIDSYWPDFPADQTATLPQCATQLLHQNAFLHDGSVDDKACRTLS